MNEDKNKMIVPLAIVVAGAMIAGAIYFGGNKEGGNVAGINRDNTETKINVDKVTAEDYVRGDRNAPIMVIEYSDIECPFCKVFHNTMTDILAKYDGKVAWTFRHFPIPQLHQKATKEAEATECAAEQGGNTTFWNYLDKVFAATNSNDSLDLAKLPVIAGELGLDVNAFNTCLSSGKYLDKIENSIQSAVKAGARGTPYSIIVTKDGKTSVINGAEPLASIEAKIDALLK